MVDLRQTAETKVVEEETKAKGWLSRNWYPFVIGAIAGSMVMWLVIKIL